MPSDKRTAILNAAIDVFLEQGFGAATVDAIRARVGGSKSTIYAYFGSKMGLFKAIVDAIVGEIVQPMAPNDSAGQPVRETLVQLAEEHMHVVLSDRHIDLVRFVAAEVKRVPSLGRDYYGQGPASGHARLEAFLAEKVRQGELTIADPVRAAEHFWGMLLHKWTLRRLYGVAQPPTPEEVDASVQAAVDAFLALYEVRPGTAG